MYNPVAGDVCKYRLITKYDQSKLEAEVNTLLAEGWQLYGPPQYHSEGGTFPTGRHSQAMTLPWRDYK